MAKKNKKLEENLLKETEPLPEEDSQHQPNELEADKSFTDPMEPDSDEPSTSEVTSDNDSKKTYEELEEEISGLKDQLLRTVAESENVRRRTEREKAEATKYSITNFAKSILSVADNLNRALESVPEENRKQNQDLNNLCIGIEMTGNELDGVYEKFEIKSINALGEKFDHNLHQAMFEIEDSTQPAGTVIQQVQKGYTIYDRLLRPAMVGVAKGGLPKEENSLDKTTEENAKTPSSAYSKQASANIEERGEEPSIKKEL